METNAITIVGLGPGSPQLLTRQAWQLLESAEEVVLRTNQHPVVNSLPPHLKLLSFDRYYEQEATFDLVYARIVDDILEMSKRPGGVIYAVPGHPFVAEATSPEIVRRARMEKIRVRIIEGLSFLEPSFTALEIDPFPHTTMIDALELATLHVPQFPPSAPVIITQVYSSHIASEIKLTLNAIYPDEHPVSFLHHVGSDDVIVEKLALYQIDRSTHIDHLTALYVPPLDPATSFETFQEVIAHLRAPDGCPWDREQTHQSLRSSLLSETYETLEAIDSGDASALQEELGDLLLQILLQSQIAFDEGEFNISDVIKVI